MNIEIIGGDPAVNKAVQARLASRGFAAAVSETPGQKPPLLCIDHGAHKILRGSQRPGHVDYLSKQEMSNVAAFIISKNDEAIVERDRLAASNAKLLAALRSIAERRNLGLGMDMPVLGRRECTDIARAAIANAEMGAK